MRTFSHHPTNKPTDSAEEPFNRSGAGTRTPVQEIVVVEIRKLLLLPLDDLLVVTRKFINPEVSRSGLDRCLRRFGVSDLRALQL